MELHDHLTIAAARAFATAAHLGQRDRDGTEHIDHVQRVVTGVELNEWLQGDSRRSSAMAIAWLHDVVEDTIATPEYLSRFGFDQVVTRAVRVLTRTEEDESYADYVERVCNETGVVGLLARAVKLADLDDNLTRCEADGNERLAARYRRAKILVLGATQQDVGV